MNSQNIIFLGVLKNSEEFYSVFRKEQTANNISFVCEDIRLYKNNNIITITEQELKKYFGEYKNKEELREKAYTYYRSNLQGNFVNIGKYKNIRISRKSAERYKSYGADERKLLIVPKLREILENSKYKNS